MSIRVVCSNCQAAFLAGDEHAGKRGKCPKCQAAVVVPAASPEVAKAVPPPPVPPPPVRPQPAASKPSAAPGRASDRDAIARELLGGFQGKIEAIRPSMAYQLGILLVALVMVLLPLIYVALIGLVGWLVYLHAVCDTGLLHVRAGGRAQVWAFLIYVAPIVAGAVAIVFMIKPLFARSAKIERRRSLTREGEPLLFAFVDRICETVGAPRPKRIDVDCEVNASASFRRGVWSMLVGNDLVLTIGMPLVVGMNTRQFTEVLAHEFGHFTQGAGMRLTFIIRSISFWFTRVVYERDAWDEALVRWSTESDGRLAIFFLLTRLFVWLTRKVLWVLMMVGHAVAGFMLRQMEYDADRTAARVVGASAAESNAATLILLGGANQNAISDLQHFYHEGRLGDNLPRLVEANLSQFLPTVHEEVAKMIETSQTGILDTHPCHKDRIANVRRENAPGVFHVERPATVLFSDFDALARNVTWDFYRGIFGTDFKPTDMHPTEDLLRRQQRDIAANKALGRYFQGAFSGLRPLGLPSGLEGDGRDAEALGASVAEARQRMLAALPQYKETFADFDKADTHLVEAEQARALIRAGFKLKPGIFSVSMCNSEETGRVTRRANEQQELCLGALSPFEAAAADRLGGALRLLRTGDMAERIADVPARLAEAEVILAAMAVVGSQLPEILQLRNQRAALGILVDNLQGNHENQSLIGEIKSRMRTMGQSIRTIHAGLGNERYPFDHAKGDISLADYALEKLPDPEDLGAILNAGSEMMDKLASLYVRMMARLTDAALEVETALGLPALPDPETAGTNG